MSRELLLRVRMMAKDQLSGPLRNVVGLGESASHQQARLKKEASDANTELKTQQQRIRRAMQEGGRLDELVARERELRDRVEETNRRLRERERLNNINARTASMHSAGSSMRSSGMNDVMQGAAMAAPLIMAAKSAMVYEKKLALVAQKTDMNAQETKAFGQRIMAVSAETGQLNDQLMEAVDWLGGKGVNVGAMDAMIPEIARFATAWDANVVDASKAAYAGFLSLKVPLDQTGRSLEIMAAAGKAGGFEVKDMAQYFPTLTSTLSSFGSTGVAGIADLSSALQVLEAKTGDGAQAANNLNNLLLFAQSKEGTKNFAKAGIDIVAVMKKAEAEGGSAIDALIGSLNKVTGGDTSKIPQIIGDMQAGAAARGLIESQKDFEDIRDQAFASLGLTQKEYARMSETSETNWNRLQTALSGVALTLGDKLLPHLTEGAKWITENINAVAAWADKNPEMASTLVKVAGGLVLAKIGMGALKIAIGTIIGPIGTLWGWWEKFKVLKEAGRFTALATNVSKAATFMGKGIAKAGAMMMTNPMVLAIMAIVLVLGVAGYLIYKHWDTISAAFWSGVEAIKSFFSGVGDWFSQKWQQIKAVFSGGIGGIAGILINFSPMGLLWTGFSKLLDWLGIDIPAKLTDVGRWAMDGLKDGLWAGAEAVFAAVKNIAGWVGDKFRAVLDINSPSRIFMGFGGDITEGLARGIHGGSGSPVAAAKSMAARVAGANFAPAGGGSVRSGGGGLGPVTIHVHGAPGQSAEEIARLVDLRLREREAQASAARRSSFKDD